MIINILQYRFERPFTKCLQFVKHSSQRNNNNNNTCSTNCKYTTAATLYTLEM